ncbi:hypothetical protein KAFR_0H02920 [Kazachstania africana CBS 2517]|uniref:Rho termination factor N-terminal domain-containing protein n=1 Tax=Kazachstania africana (strain ATCC 22294 / BCRC 22015 / CBS 2517 / CECT 1963 / NBRC 1671 / NRRL Y-8276) TaxID=1071382 RepID=H2AZE5_KAZAF|nr:hypothetical protein KAFR_0H02920 [Kazachstania africana CBS 2517]CCF59701.1 hypothetical protein KAFR_0H02920 [Kazachstania africana CBS 2517]
MGTFDRWKKAELLDLVNKLKLDDVSFNLKKMDMIKVIEDHLSRLGEPLDTEVEFPELKSFYAVETSSSSSDDEEETSKGERNVWKCVVHANENVQDFLSSVATLMTIFYGLELFKLIHSVAIDKDGFKLILVWFVAHVVVPVLASYYINFVRYDLMMEFDPFTINILKALISLAMKNATCHEFKAIYHSVGELSMIFSVVGLLITFYVY